MGTGYVLSCSSTQLWVRLRVRLVSSWRAEWMAWRGCAYRCLQMLFDCCNHRRHTSCPTPTILEIQRTLVALGPRHLDSTLLSPGLGRPRGLLPCDVGSHKFIEPPLAAQLLRSGEFRVRVCGESLCYVIIIAMLNDSVAVTGMRTILIILVVILCSPKVRIAHRCGWWSSRLTGRVTKSCSLTYQGTFLHKALELQ